MSFKYFKFSWIEWVGTHSGISGMRLHCKCAKNWSTILLITILYNILGFNSQTTHSNINFYVTKYPEKYSAYKDEIKSVCCN